ncbi:MAG: hypothetical protein AAFQ80_22560 [Cyanobacteria bacterium J06621_8]
MTLESLTSPPPNSGGKTVKSPPSLASDPAPPICGAVSFRKGARERASRDLGDFHVEIHQSQSDGFINSPA